MATALQMADQAAYPVHDGDTGPTYREWVAGLIVAQMAGRHNYTVRDARNEAAAADAAVRLADALCARLAQS